MKFVKMHGCGNDYVYLDCFAQKAPENPVELSKRLSAFHTGIGSDGLILILPCEGADARMRIFNKDGSEGEMCGNGIRCVGKYLYDTGIARRDVLNIQTGAGLKTLEMRLENGKAVGAKVDMGCPCTEPMRIPVRGETNRLTLAYDGGSAEFFCLSMGNPHAVTFDVEPVDEVFYRLGPFFETHPAFPNRVNLSFCTVVDRTHLITRIWERGSGATLACGTGASATLAAAYLTDRCGRAAYVKLPGGELFIEYDERNGHVFMTGPAEVSFTGEFE